ncbi:MAG: hypothetical protein KBE30_03815, partial [Desulfobacter sp.]|nr:hypothetical protein [Desulfobacter sp.]
IFTNITTQKNKKQEKSYFFLYPGYPENRPDFEQEYPNRRLGSLASLYFFSTNQKTMRNS